MSNRNDSNVKTSKDSNKDDVKFGFKFKYSSKINKIKNMEGILMRKMKKFVSLAVTLSLVSSLVAPAFAATSNNDVTGTQFEDSVTRMGALGIIGGYPDGTFKPQNNITRAEFAKIAVYMLGKQDAAALSSNSTKFKDVAKDNWAAGVINVATNEGIIKGYPDGTFKPDANVSYAEAVTILVRSLGLSPLVEGKGAWPANYMSKASALGILDGVTGIGGSDRAIRGNIAKLAYNTMLENKWGETSYNDKGEIVYGELSKTLLSDKYADFATTQNNEIKMKVLKDALIVATKYNTAGMNEKITVQVDPDNQLAVTFVANQADLKVDKSMSQANLLGRKANIVLGKDNKVVAINVEGNLNKEGRLEKYDSSKNTITVAGVKYDLAASPVVTLNNQASVIGNLLTNRDMVAITFNSDNKVDNISATRADVSVQDIVKEIKTNGNVVTINSTFTNDELKDVNTVIVKNGQEVSKDQIKVGDIIVRTTVAAGDVIYTVSDAKVTGNVSGIEKGKIDASAYRLTVNGKAYEMANLAQISTNGNIENNGAMSDILNMLNKPVTLSLNANGDIAFVNGTAQSEAGLQYGIITKALWDGPVDTNGKQIEYIKVLASNGQEKIYQVTGDTLVNKTIAAPAAADKVVNATNLSLGMTVQFKVNANGTIDAANLTTLSASDLGTAQATLASIESNVDAAKLAVATGSDTLQAINDGTTNYFVGANTVILNANASNDKLEVVSGFDAINTKAVAFSGSAYVIYDHNTKIIKVMIVDLDSYQTTTDKYGVLTQAPFLGTNSDGDKVWYAKVFSQGQESTYELTAANVVAQKAGDMINYTLNEGKINSATLALGATHDAEYYANLDNENLTVKQLSGSLVIFNGTGSTVVTDKDTVVYDLTGATPKMSSVSNIANGSMVISIDNDSTPDGIADILVIVK